MSKFNDLKIGTKLILSFIIVSLVGVIIGVVGYSNIKNFDNNDKGLYIEMIIFVVTGGFLISLAIGLFLARLISRPIIMLTEIANKVATGDIDVKVTADSNDEIGQLSQSFINVIHNAKEQAMALERIAEGDLTVKLDIKSDKDILGNNINLVIERPLVLKI